VAILPPNFAIFGRLEIDRDRMLCSRICIDFAWQAVAIYKLSGAR